MRKNYQEINDKWRPEQNMWRPELNIYLSNYNMKRNYCNCTQVTFCVSPHLLIMNSICSPHFYSPYCATINFFFQNHTSTLTIFLCTFIVFYKVLQILRKHASPARITTSPDLDNCFFFFFFLLVFPPSCDLKRLKRRVTNKTTLKLNCQLFSGFWLL